MRPRNCSNICLYLEINLDQDYFHSNARLAVLFALPAIAVTVFKAKGLAALAVYILMGSMIAGVAYWAGTGHSKRRAVAYEISAVAFVTLFAINQSLISGFQSLIYLILFGVSVTSIVLIDESIP